VGAFRARNAVGARGDVTQQGFLVTFVGRRVDELGNEAIPKQRDLGREVGGFGFERFAFGHGATPERILLSAPRIRRFAGVAQSAKRVGLNTCTALRLVQCRCEPSQPLARSPVPEETQAIIAAVVAHLRPPRLRPSEEMERRLQHSARRIVGSGVFTERVERRRTRIVVRQRLLDSGPPGGRVGRERNTPATDRARGGQSFDRTAQGNLGPRSVVFKTSNDDRLNYLEEIMPKA